MSHRPPRLLVRKLSSAVLHEVSFELAAGEIVCLQGPSGAGKSRLLRALCDLDENRGEVRLDDTPREAIEAPQWRRLAALLPAESSWWEETAGAHFPRPPPYPPEDLGLEAGILGEPVARLSSGERQRLALLRVLALDPRVLLLDEPTSNLDAENGRRIEDLVRRHAEATDASVLWITHDAAQAARVGRRTLTIDAGTLG
ncbi:MAG: ABC transporter ATP-binding protein [Gammaproteobacteria bacterium]|nr:ABC transporter ATP-binding protein [Gammaproteobacteria bacterium]